MTTRQTMITWKTILTLALLPGLRSLPALAAEIGAVEHDFSFLGTVNVLREFGVNSTTNLVTATGNFEGSPDWNGGPADSTIDGSSRLYNPKMTSDTTIITYTLPGLRTVSSLAISYKDAVASNNNAKKVRLEGSADGGKTWFDVIRFNTQRQADLEKRFPPATVNRLRLSQTVEGENEKYSNMTVEVQIYADPETPLLLFGSKETGAFDYLRDLSRAQKITVFGSPGMDTPGNLIWLRNFSSPMDAGKILFKAGMTDAHRGMYGESEHYGSSDPGRRLFLRFDLDKIYLMNFGVINGGVFGGNAQAEFYTAKGKLDPGTLKGNSIKEITGQGWILQKAWNKDTTDNKSFLLQHPGKYNQMLVVWDAVAVNGCGQRWNHMEMYGFETPDAGDALKNPQK